MTNPDVFCAGCGRQLTEEDPCDDPEKRNPCPDCGSLSRKLFIEVNTTVHVTSHAEGIVVTYPQTLLGTCKGLIDDGRYSISVVVAHMACEVAVERAISMAFVAKGIQSLKQPVLEFVNGYNLATDRIRKLYNALMDDNIEQLDFWPGFKTSAARRNDIVHKSLSVGRIEAESSYEVARALVAHLNQ